MSQFNFFVVIPARFDSKRLHGKALLNINGKSLIEHVYSAALKTVNLEHQLQNRNSKHNTENTKLATPKLKYKAENTELETMLNSKHKTQNTTLGTQNSKYKSLNISTPIPRLWA